MKKLTKILFSVFALLFLFTSVIHAQDGDVEAKFSFSSILNTLLGGASLLFGGLLLKVKGKIRELMTLGRHLVEAGDAIDESLADNQITKAEIGRIKREWADVKLSFKALINFKRD